MRLTTACLDAASTKEFKDGKAGTGKPLPFLISLENAIDKDLWKEFKNRGCPRCITVISSYLQGPGVTYEIDRLGEITILNHAQVDMAAVKQVLEKHDFELIQDKDELLVEQVRKLMR